MVHQRSIILSSLLTDLFFFGLFISLFGPSNIKMMEEFDVDFATIGLVVSAQSLGTVLCFFTGAISDKYGHYNVVRLSLLVLGVFTILMGVSPSISFLILFSFVIGIAFGMFNTSFNPVIFDLYPDEKFKMLNLVLVSFGIGIVFGPAIIAGMISFFGNWRIGYILFGLLLVVVAIFELMIKTQSGGSSKVSRGQMHFDRPFLLLLACMFFFYLFATGITSWIPTYIVKTNKVEYLEAGVVLSCFWLVVTLTRLYSWKITKVLGQEKVITCLSLLGFCAGLLSVFCTGFISNLIVWGLMGLAFALVYPSVISIAHSNYQNSPGKAIGRLISLGSVGAFVSAPMIGLIANFTSADIATLVIPFSSLIVAILFFKLSHLKNFKSRH
ncbi:MAG: MFS transporter [Nitrososphaeria archaeon]